MIQNEKKSAIEEIKLEEAKTEFRDSQLQTHNSNQNLKITDLERSTEVLHRELENTKEALIIKDKKIQQISTNFKSNSRKKSYSRKSTVQYPKFRQKNITKKVLN